MGDVGWIPGFKRSPGEGKGYPLQCSGLENSMDCVVCVVTESQTQLSDFHFGAQENLGDYNLFLRNNKLGQEKDFVTRKVPHGPTCFHFQVTIARSVTQSCPTLCHPMVYTAQGILQARTLEWVAFPFSRGSSQPRGQTKVSCFVGRFITS